ncbi:NAD-P-binding protein [Ganoderma leucocontextum]|nr:NAD-P-binding protein [Ganoderma leucocontextum]
MSSSPAVVLIAGCSEGGIGFAAAKEYASRGCKVHATARRLETMESLTHANAERLKLDVTDEPGVKAAVEHVIKKEGRIDILFNNPGITCSVADISFERIQRTFDTNLHGIIHMSQTVIPHMAPRKRGTIVNIGIYAASKAAVHSLSDSRWQKCRPLGISIVLVSSGDVGHHEEPQLADNMSVPPTTLYTDYLGVIREDFQASRTDIGMPLPQYARDLIANILVRSGLFIIGLLKRIPRGILLRLLWSLLVERRREQLAKAK